MAVFLAFFLVSVFMYRTLMPVDSATGVTHVHLLCVQACPTSHHRALYSAIVCGTSLPASELKDNFRATGLIHLLVVSGSHLVFVQTLLTRASRRLKPSWRNALVAVGLACFAAAANFQTPLLRALCAMIAGALSDRMHLNWTRVQTATVAGFATLPFCETEFEVYSLTLSWIAALALATETNTSDVSLIDRARASLRMNARVYFWVLPALLPLTAPHPLSILFNFVVGPLLATILFPLSALALVVRTTVPWVDWLWSFTLSLVSWLGEQTPRSLLRFEFSLVLVVLYVGALTAWSLRKTRNWRSS